MLFVFWHLSNAANRQKNQLGMMMGISCGTVFFLQTVTYVLINVGILRTGGYCPFIVGGGAGTIVTYVLLGILLSIYRYQNVVGEKAVSPGKIHFGRKRIIIEK